MSTRLPHAVAEEYVKGVFISRFDLSIGPMPVARYPADFITDNQSMRLALHSMVQLNTARGRRVMTMLTFDDIASIGFGALGNLSSIGFYSLIVFVNVNAPMRVSENTNRILDLLASLDSRLASGVTIDEALAKEIYVEACKLLAPADKDSLKGEEKEHQELSQEVARAINAIAILIKGDPDTIASHDLTLLDCLTELVGNLNLLAIRLNITGSLTGLGSLLYELQKVRYFDGRV